MLPPFPFRSPFTVSFLLPSLLLLLISHLPSLTTATSLTITLPSNLRLLPPSTRAFLTTTTKVHKTTITRWNTFYLQNITYPATYLLDIACRDYDFERLRVEVDGEGKLEVWNRWYGGGEKVVGGEGGVDVQVEVRVLRNRDYYEERPGFSPLSLLKNPMILIAVVGLAFVVGMPYLLDSMDPEMKAEFEEQQKKSILGGGAGANPLQNFDMAAWMAGKTSGSGGGGSGGGGSGGDGDGGGKSGKSAGKSAGGGGGGGSSSGRPQTEDEGGAAAPRARRRG